MISNFRTTVYQKQYKGRLYLNLKVINDAYKKSQGGAHAKSTALGIQITPEQWNTADPNSWIIGTDEDTISKNLLIRKMISRLEAIYYRLKQQTAREPYAEHVLETYQAELNKIEKPRKKLISFIDQYVTDAKDLSESTASLYKENLKAAVKGFLKEKYKAEDIYLDEIDTAFLYRFEMYLNHATSKRGKPYKKSTAGEYVNKMVAVMNHARKTGEISADIMAEYEAKAMISDSKPAPREIISQVQEAVFWKIPPGQLHKIETMQVQGHAVRGETETATGNQFNYDLVRIRLLFLIQSWTGFAFADLCAHRDVRNLIVANLSGQKSIIYYRAKNGELAIVPLFEQTEKLLQAVDYNVTPMSSYDTYNRKIKALLRYYVIDIPEETITHLGRHLFGSRMLSMGFSMEAISRMMGHTSISMTEKIYARIDLTTVQADYDRIQLTSTQLGNRIAI